MPELPEVEIAARNLRRWLDGRTVVRAEAEPTRVFRGSSARTFQERLAGRRLERLDRRGKYLLFAFDGGVGLVSHLGMTGKWVRRDAGAGEPYSRARLRLDDGAVLHYRDPRLLGRIELAPAAALAGVAAVARLGPDPLNDDLTPALLADRLRTTRRAIKVALLDQSVLAGVGNIQAAEALWRARIHPTRSAHRLTPAEVARLCRGILASIAHSLCAETSEEIPYVEEPGSQNPFLVYARRGEPCRRCRRRIAAIRQARRTTFYCPRCQRRGSSGVRRRPSAARAGRRSRRP